MVHEARNRTKLSAAGRRARSTTAAIALLAFGLLVPTGAAVATSFVTTSDEDLARDAPLVVVGDFTGIDRGSAGGYHTDYAVRIARVLKGDDPGPAVMVRVVGGEGPHGDELEVFGAPTFEVGDRAILFLDRAAGGTYSIHQFLLGAFHRRVERDVEVAVRELRGAEEVVRPGRVALGAEVARDFDAFAEWLAAAGAGSVRDADYFLADAAEPARASSAYTLVGESAARWFEFDKGGYVTFFADRNGIPGVSADVFGAMQRALRAWSSVEDAKVSMRYGGTTGVGAFGRSDGLNAVLFGDPYGEVSGTFSCEKGGVLALGGVRRGSGSKSFLNGSAAPVVEGDVVINDGAACFFDRHEGLDGEEVLGHELGHALGIGHSKVKDALMWASARGDARGCRLGADDIAALYHLYPASAGLTADPGSLAFEAGAYSAVEGDSVTVTVLRTGGGTGPASVRVLTKTSTAKAPADFAHSDQTLTWANGDSGPKSISISIVADTVKEPAESFLLELTQPAGATAGTTTSATVTVSDSPVAPRGKGGAPGDQAAAILALATRSVQVHEGAGAVELQVSRSGGSGAVAVEWRTANGAARAPADYVAASGAIRWEAGDTSPKVVRIAITNDKAVEKPEAFLVRLVRPTGGAVLGEIAATSVRIADDDVR
jgi:hypothetical protein